MRICSQDIKMEFGIEKCDMQIMKSGKQQMMEGMELPNQDKIRRKGNVQILGNIGGRHRQTSREERKN